MITEDQVKEAQAKWGAGVVEMGRLRDNWPECEKFASQFLDDRYYYQVGPVLFKPTKAAEKQFRSTKAEALSYFINGPERACVEDKGFALQPWTNVRFENAGYILEENRAIAMGNYFFTDLDGGIAKVEYTFGYKLVDGDLRIDLHHSSFPYAPPQPS